ncbi:Uu.00g006490.m01.CDS01 [Anthostomella pinea]|uniref:Uu.00g006490.m01.CDS01 n=1 Tax=Anthostomella pinea TaxID=933095 RepID=A0AAI8VKA2_9PEZI|nr:Uu.00g006490.m01.CDS01 [Anthostomella pinea]
MPDYLAKSLAETEREFNAKFRAYPFTLFNNLAPEIRHKIWRAAVHAQDRVVHMRPPPKTSMYIARAPWPLLFLVCKESKHETEKFYQRLPGGQMMSTPRPLSDPCCARGPVVSFFDDIVAFKIDFSIPCYPGHAFQRNGSRPSQYSFYLKTADARRQLPGEAGGVRGQARGPPHRAVGPRFRPACRLSVETVRVGQCGVPLLEELGH